MICDHRDSKEIYKFYTAYLYRCNECGIIFSSRYRGDFDSASRYEKYYRNETAGRFGFGLEYIVRLFRFFRALKIFTVSPRTKSILDIGSGRGFTLYYLKKYYKYKKTVGTQISKNAFDFSRDKLGLQIYNKDLLELSLGNAGFDVITIWHVLEHVIKPEHYIDKIYELLDDHGKLIIEVPNFNSWTRILTGRYWLGFDLKYHLFFFTPASLSSLLIKHGFKIKVIHTFSLEYSAFTSAQSIINALTRSDSIFFRALQTGEFNYLIAVHAFLIILIMPLCFLINILLYFSKRGEVLFILAEKK
jgi:SAM-dependent methyltransferase